MRWRRRLQRLEAQNTAAAPPSSSVAEGEASAAEWPIGEELHGDARSISLLRKLAEKQGEIHRLKVCGTIQFSPHDQLTSL